LDGFPLDYYSVCYPFFGIQTRVSGVGFNLAAALTRLGNQVDFASLISADDNGMLARKALAAEGVPDGLVLSQAAATAQSVILYDPDGRRQIHVDLKDIQDLRYPENIARDAVKKCDLAILSNINFSRNLIPIAREAGVPIATDVHALAGFEDDYNRDFMEAAEILFLSDESLPGAPEAAAEALLARYETIDLLVIGLGEKGALLVNRVDGVLKRFPAVFTRPVVNTIGAGDALLAAFLDRYLKTRDPTLAMDAALVFASYKVGEKSAGEGFLNAAELDEWIEKVKE
jgi:acarbose 7IV-phosphotransferase